MTFSQVSLLVAGGNLFLGVFLFAMLVTKAGSGPAPRWLGALILVCALNASHGPVMGVLGWSTSGQLFEPLQFLLPPLLAAYAVTVQGAPVRWRIRTLAHLGPFVVAVAVSVVLGHGGPVSGLVSVAFWAFLTVQMLVYLVPTLGRLHRYRASLVDRVSNLAPADLGWLGVLLLTSAALCLLSVVVLVLLHTVAPSVVGPWVSGAMTLAVWVLGYRGLVQRSAGLPVVPQDRPPLGPDQAKKLAEEVVQTFRDAKPHLDPDLDLVSLARLVGAPRNHVSYAINTQLGKNFYDLVNLWRVEEFRSLAADPARANDKILTLAFDAGFNSKPTFNKVVLKLTGKTPSQVREEEIASRRTR